MFKLSPVKNLTDKFNHFFLCDDSIQNVRKNKSLGGKHK